jgi:hypothetical protein
MSRFGVTTLVYAYDLYEVKFNNKFQLFFKNVVINTSFLSDEQYNELIKIESTRIGQGF